MDKITKRTKKFKNLNVTELAFNRENKHLLSNMDKNDTFSVYSELDSVKIITDRGHIKEFLIDGSGISYLTIHHKLFGELPLSIGGKIIRIMYLQDEIGKIVISIGNDVLEGSLNSNFNQIVVYDEYDLFDYIKVV